MSTEYEEKAPERRQLGQGLTIFHEDQSPDVDILAVPGLGTNPVECWAWTANDSGHSKPTKSSAASGSSERLQMAVEPRRKFNWLKDPDGLASLFPKSRIMLYDYASAWMGPRKVRVTMKHICTWLLGDLREKRKGVHEISRPLIIIGHSMGGIVVAKTLSIAQARREFEPILTCTVGCIFFGAPFRGSEMAKVALMYSSVFGKEAYESLLSFMKAGKNDTLDEVTSDFMEITGKLNPPISLCCVYEQVPTDVSYSERFVPRPLQQKAVMSGAQAVLRLGGSTFKTGTHFVDMESATLQGAHIIGMTADHRNLIRFESTSSERFLPVRVALSDMVRHAKTNARKRSLLSGQNLLTQRAVNMVRQSLEGVDMRSRFRMKVNQRQISSWLTTEALYQDWLYGGSRAAHTHSYLLVKGGPGLGKTNASLAAIQEITKVHHDEQQTDAVGQSGILCGYFLCDSISGCSTAEDVLKSLITQIINQEESLAQHGARWFVPDPRSRASVYDEDVGSVSNAKATTTVDNLWKCLQDMIDDPVVTTIHFVISNIHLLDSASSTTTLLSKLRADAVSLEGQALANRKAKWLITSRNDKHIRHFSSTTSSISVIDLENDHEYGTQKKDERQKHTRDKVMQLRISKEYSSDLAYYVRNSIESQSEDKMWIDVLCILLEAKPTNSSSPTIRRWLREVGSYNIHELIDHAWESMMSHLDKDERLETEELMQALTIAYEPPSIADLAVLAQIDDLERLNMLISKCSPILQIGEVGAEKVKIIFTNTEFKARLTTISHGRLDSSNPVQRRYHGQMALRCFEYIKTSIKSASGRGRLAEVASTLMRSSTVNTLLDDEPSLIDFSVDEEVENVDMNPSEASTRDCSYPIKYLFDHLSKGFPDVAQELCEDDPEFWGQTSRLRTAWLKEFQVLKPDHFNKLNTNGMSALHIAAGIGAKDLVTILVARYGPPALSWTTDDGMTALHVAAFNEHGGVVDALIRAGADVEAGDGQIGTALHLASKHGKCDTMTLLIAQGANINASSEEDGPVINAAILSGNIDAVSKIMEGDVRFDLDYTKYEAPLSLAARFSERKLFESILETGREKWLQNVKLLDQALVKAASFHNKLESVQILLAFAHVYTNNTVEQAVLAAAREQQWASVNELLDFAIRSITQGTRRDVKLDEVFYLAATGREDRLELLAKIWSFTNHTVAQDIRDFSLYQATVIKKDTTVLWLLETCKANPNATAEKPGLVAPDSEEASSSSSADFSTALNAASSSGNVALTRSLLRKGAEIDGENGYALQLAASEGHTEVVNVLLEHGALVDRKVSSSDELGFLGSTALQAACENGRLGVVETLLKHGANPNLGGGALTNPITAATQRAQPDILKVLLEAPTIDVNLTGGEEGSTALINAATYISTELVELLIQKGADVNAQNPAGDTALIMAALKGEKTCVEMLCENGADVTYRSPRRGLAIQVAAEALHPLCAHVLAERMASMIEEYRKHGVADRKFLAERDRTIETLEGILAETREQLDIASRDVETHRVENERLVSISDLQGSSYEYVDEQNKAIKRERDELSKQLDSLKGQIKIANESTARKQRELEKERATSDDLRKRQGYATLQQEKQAALDELAQEREAAIRTSVLEEEARTELRDEILQLEEAIRDLGAEMKTVELAAKFAEDKAEAERREKEELQKEILALQANARDMEETLARVQAAAASNKTKSPAPASPGSPANQGYFGRASTTNGVPEGEGTPVRKPVPGGSPITTSGIVGSPVTSPMSPGSPWSNGGASPGFRTIHGRHRPDGSLGGYRSARSIPQVARTTSDSLYTSSVKATTGETGSMSTESLHSVDEGMAGPAGSPKVAQRKDSAVKEQPKRSGSGNHILWS